MKLDTHYFDRCILILERAYTLLNSADSKEIEYDLYRSACIKEFEIILEQSGKLLKKRLKIYFSSSGKVDTLSFKEIFKYAVVHGIMNEETC
ncbi:MAG: nucleotidyltransferase substrate binding protein [Saprospiraceae bacterium]|nr:nucleotidyltransferase substrate binding protein [Saprospiraceae bacterium]